MSQFHFRVSCFVIAIFFCTSEGFAQIAAFSGTSTPTASSVTNTSASPLSRGSGLNVNSGGTFNSNDWGISDLATAVSDDDYVEWDVSADSGFEVIVESIEIDYDRSNSGPSEIAIRTSIDGFASNIFLDNSVNSSGEVNTISSLSLNSGDGGTIVFRLYGYDASSSTGSFDVEDDLGTILGVSGTGIVLDGEVNSASGPAPEPTNYPTLFSCTTQSDDQINLSWTDATGTDLPDGYLIKWSDVSYAAVTSPSDLSDSNGANSATVAQGTETASVTGLDPNTQYFFKIWSYSNSGSTIDYKTSPAPPQTDCTTDNGPCFEESFDNNNAPGGGYGNGSFTGDEATTWDYQGARNPSVSDQITGTSIGFGDSGENPRTLSTNALAGVQTLSYDTRTYFSGGDADDRTVEVWVNGILRDSYTLTAEGSVFTRIINNINVAGTPLVEFRSTGSRQVVIDNISWTCFAGCTPTHTITSFLPTSGPAGTLVTISGSGFTSATAASFSGTASPSISVINDTTAIAEVPENGASGAIGITVAGCEALSSSNFTLLTDNGDCGSSGGGGGFATDLFISEVYDASSGSLSYIEVFNGTNATVDLGAANYEIRVRTGASTDNDYAMTGNLPSGDTYILRLGGGASICSGFSPDQDLPSASGFNGNDRIYLRKNGSDLDYAPNPNHPDAGGDGTEDPGFGQSRNATVTSPSIPYVLSEWTIGTTENCDDLGTPPFVPNGSGITINSQPVDVNCTAVTFSVAATANPGFESGAGAYTWRYNEPGTDTWQAISTLNAMSAFTVTGAGTDTITITGSTADLLDYQFYVDMGTSGTPQCRVFSNAAQYTYDTRAFYRSISSGSWTDPSRWEMSDTEGGAYSAACQYPVSRNSDKIIIQPSHSLSLDDVDIEVDQLDIQSTGQLSIRDAGKLIVENGNSGGADLIVIGTLEDEGTISNGIEFMTGATWELDPTGTIVKTSTSSVAQYRDNYEAGIVSIPATASWIYRRENSGSNVSVATVDMYYPNLTFENDAFGTYTPSSLFYIFQGAGNPPVIYGDLDIGGSGIGNYNLRTNTTNAQPILVEGDLIIQTGSTLRNSAISGGSNGAGFEVRGDLIINGTLELTAWTAPGQGQLVLSGNQNQTASPSTAAVIVSELEVNKASGKFLAELSMEVRREGRFLNGIYNIDPTAPDEDELLFTSNASSTGMSNSSFVVGTVMKTGTADFVFPIGDTLSDGTPFCQPARIFDLSANGGFLARYFAEAHPNAGDYYDGESNNPTDFQEISNCQYWNLVRANGFSANAKIGLTYSNPMETCDSIGDPSSVFIARYNPLGSNWEQPISEGSTTNASESVSDGVLNPMLGGYGDFALTSDNPNFNVLPITLLSFTAEAAGESVRTAWVTASEINNDYFTIERSKDGTFWEKAGEVNGAGDSHTSLSYSFTDDRPYTGISYYRLRQTDFDGTATTGDVRAVEIKQNGDFGLDKVYRSQDGLNVVYRSASPYVVIEIYDLLGKRLRSEQIGNSGNGFGTILPDLVRGAYLLRISYGEDMDTEKFFW